MNTLTNQDSLSNTTGNGYCTKTFVVDGQMIINNYKCNQQTFTASDLWKLTSRNRTIVRSKGVLFN
jgi:hypothetical protein